MSEEYDSFIISLAPQCTIDISVSFCHILSSSKYCNFCDLAFYNNSMIIKLYFTLHKS